MTALLVAATGGHLTELARLRPRLVAGEHVIWVTFAGRQSDQLLAGEEVVHAHPTPPRDYMGVARNLRLARRLLRERRIERVISNGAGVALSFLPLARARGIETHYVECAARATGPSLTGRLLSAVPGIRLYTQFPEWAGRRWVFGGSIVEGFEVTTGLPERSPRRVLVTLGTMTFPFTRLVDRLRKVLPPDVEVVWQTGGTPREGLVNARPSLSPDELRQELSQADVVIAHGGLGSALDTLTAGRLPVLVPRRRAFGEHVDDHQAHMSYGFQRRGLAIAREADALSWNDIERAASLRVRSVNDPPPFRLR
jgi:UDP-N-acetylglucosamine--N-acetylmuramyl-(pentapeptide) pyrophosphoryl-undecaprenol N-acetylglucosamine transferase